MIWPKAPKVLSGGEEPHDLGRLMLAGNVMLLDDPPTTGYGIDVSFYSSRL